VTARQQGVPGAQLLAQAIGLAQDLLGSALVIPEPGSDGDLIQIVQTRLLGT